MMKPITSAMAAVLALCSGSSPVFAKSQASAAAPFQPSHITETSEGFAICTCASACSAAVDKRPAPIRIGGNVRVDPALIKAAGRNDKDSRHAK